ncbi:hypothetical protein V7149_18475 [Bacillus sp. JJ1503]|uniref:hypothetical protein n=1 Tax=Bacillus sp. JJ1503 TaxID=3122956 RepID=UPI003000A517
MQRNLWVEAAFIGALSLDSTIEAVDGLLPSLWAAKDLAFKKVYLLFDPHIPFNMIGVRVRYCSANK